MLGDADRKNEDDGRKKRLPISMLIRPGVDDFDHALGTWAPDQFKQITILHFTPWQTDFNECSNQPIDVSYPGWCNIYPESTGDPIVPDFQNTFWWPAHRPMWVNYEQGGQGPWTPNIPQTNLGDTQMVSEWSDLGFILQQSDGSFAQVEAKGPNF
jgi:hypothetical protein